MSCKYYNSDPDIFMYTPECADASVHPQDIDGDFCQYCGEKIVFLDGVTPKEAV